MKTKNITASLVKNYLSNNPFINDFLERNLINASALARELLPKIKQENKKATIESITIAIKRLSQSNQNTSKVSEILQKVISNVQLVFKTDLVLVSLKQTSDLPKPSNFKLDETFHINQGAQEITIIIDKTNLDLINENSILSKKENLSSISLKDTLYNKDKINYRTTPGFVYTFLSKITKEGINIEDMVSTQSGFTFIVEENSSLKVLKLCRNIIDAHKH